MNVEESEISIFISGFEAACLSSIFKVQIKGTVYSALELMNILISLILGPKNCSHIASPKIVKPLSTMITCNKAPEQITACKLVWKILDQCLPSENFLEDLKPLKHSLKSLECSQSMQLQTISKCVILTLERTKGNSGL